MSDTPLGSHVLRGPQITEREIRGVTFPPDQKTPDGYQIRFRVEPAPGAEEVWTEWFFLPHHHLAELVQSLATYMSVEGHLSTSRGRSTH